MVFNDIIGHEQPKRILQNAITEGRFAHAYLFHGMAGLGKRSLAIALAVNLFCPERNVDACGVCPVCRRIKENKHPDFFIIEPSGNNIKIEQIRNIQKRAQFRPYESMRKVFLITQAECLTRDASNCLLKILEEPPADTIFLLTANNMYSLMPTIISRCQTIPVGKVSPDKIEYLLQSHGIEPEKAKLCAALSDGIPGAALELAFSENGQEIRKTVFEITKAISLKDINQLLNMAEELEKKKELPDIIEQLVLWYRDRLIWNQTGETKLVVNIDMLEELKLLSDDRDILLTQIEYILEAKSNLNQNVNTRLALEVLLLRLAGLHY